MKRICAGLLAHVDAGKTTLSEALLYRGGCLKKLNLTKRAASKKSRHALSTVWPK